MSIPRDLIKDYPGLGDWSILTCYRGSIAHGTYRSSKEPTSIDDKDAMAFCVPPAEFYLTLMGYAKRGTREVKRNEWDIVIYEIKKAIRLLAQGNPNVLQCLWLDGRHYIKVTDAGRLLLANRDVFTGKHVYKPYVGYARGQLHRMTHQKFEGYMGMKRKAIVEKFGYDTKNASHLIRILRQGIEFMATGEMIVERQDAQELLAIKRGEWQLQQVKDEADRLFAKAEDALIHSKLPERPNRVEVNKLVWRVIQVAWEQRGNWPPEMTDGVVFRYAGGQQVENKT